MGSSFAIIRCEDSTGSYVRLGLIQVQTEALARELFVNLSSGALFGAVAEQHSIHPSKVTGGDMGTLRVTDLSPELRAALKGLTCRSTSDKGASERGGGRIRIGSVEAVGRVDSEVTGIGLERIAVTVRSTSAVSELVTVPAGTVFVPFDSGVQRMIVRSTVNTTLPPHARVVLTLNVACLDMTKKTPTKASKFDIAPALAPAELLRLMAAPAFAAAEFRIQQFAVWTISNNPLRKDYPGVGPFAYLGQPKGADFEAVRQLLIAAKVDPNAYLAFQNTR